MNQCSILYVEPGARAQRHADGLRELGFSVDVLPDLPSWEVLTKYHAVVVRVHSNCNLAVLAARMRAKRQFGRRVLIGLVPESCTPQQRRDANISGFDETLPEACSPRDLAAHILRKLRAFPEYRCLLRAPTGRRKAA